MAYTMHVVSHTHWDREWYLTFQQFRLRLIDLIDHLLETLDTDPGFKHFNLDGQTIILEDYLQIRPHNEEKLRRYISEGRIQVGPWYQLNDEYLVSGESTIRSLLIGHRIARRFGRVTKVGYIPDQFGNISQMPQIFREFGIDNAILGRGLQLTDDRKMEFLWEGSDGTQILASLMAFWYNNAQRFPYETGQAVEYVKRIRDAMAPKAATPYLLLMNGVDHLEAQAGLPDILRHVNEQLKDDRLVHSTLPDYVSDVKRYIEKNKIDLQVVRGELREDREGSVLAGTLSTRMYLKQANHEAETWLQKYTEPSCAFAWMMGKDYPSDFLTYAWKLLMQNHPHDSICGCSIDQVHDEMMPRFEQVGQIAQELTGRSLDHIASRVKTDSDALLIFNPLNWPRTDRVSATIDLPVGDPDRVRPSLDPEREVPAIELLDPQGRTVPYKLIQRTLEVKQVLSPVELPMGVMVRRFQIEFIAEDVPACGYKTYSVRRVDREPQFEDTPAQLVYSESAISNGLVRLSPDAGGVRIEDQKSDEQHFYSELGVLEDGGDVGDEYRYVKPPNDRIVSTMRASPEITLVDRSPISATYKLRGVMRLPASAELDRQGRASETVDCRFTSYFTISTRSPRIEVVTEFENKAKDHRLRVLFPTGIETNIAHAEGHFDVITRPVRPPDDWEGAAPFYPQRSWVDVNDGKQGLTIINKGLPEYEIYDDAPRTLAVTLLRCVGRLSSGVEAPGAKQTPGAQCIGTHRFEYAILLHRRTWQEDRVWQQAHQHNVPMFYAQTGAHDGDLPLEYSFVQVSPPELIVSAIKKAEEKDSLLVRFFNILDEEAHDARITVAGAVFARTVNLNEEPGNELIVEADGTVTIDVPAKKIATIEFVLEG